MEEPFEEPHEMAVDVEAVQRLGAAMEAVDDPLRKLGVYVNTTAISVTDAGPVAVVDALIGDAAMSARVQDPAQASADDVLRQMEHGQKKSDFDQTKEDLMRRLAEGKPLFDEEA